MEMRSDATSLSKTARHRQTSDLNDMSASKSHSAFSHPPASGEGEDMHLLQLAGNLLVRSRQMENRIAAIEAASQACKCAKVVAEAIINILEKARELLLKLREIPDLQGRLLLANSFNNILKQIDLIVAEGYYDNKNLAENENIVISTDNSGRQRLSIDGIDMSSGGLGLLPLEGEAISNTEAIERLTKVETAASSLVAHSLSYDAIASLLQTRMNFARGLIDVLEEGNNQINNSRTGHDALARMLSEICGTASNENVPLANSETSLSDDTITGHTPTVRHRP